MRVLVFNTGNLADVMQMLPAFTDAQRAHGHLVIDVIVDDRWSEVAQWHPAVGQVFSIPSRSWQRGIVSLFASEDVKRLKKQLRKYSYDWFIDLYGGWSSALFARTVQCASAGFSSCRDKKQSSSVLYHHRQPENHSLHRVEQVRRLLAHCLHYPPYTSTADYGLNRDRFCSPSAAKNAICLTLGAKDTRLRLPPDQASQLIQQLSATGRPVRLLWRDRASGDYLRSIAENTDAELMPSLKLSGIASVLLDCCSVITVDNGLAHLAAALQVPMVRLHSVHTPDQNAAYGGQQTVLKEGEQSWAPDELVSSLWQLVDTMPSADSQPYSNASVASAAGA